MTAREPATRRGRRPLRECGPRDARSRGARSAPGWSLTAVVRKGALMRIRGQPEAGAWPGSAALPRRDGVRGFGMPCLAGAVQLVAARRRACRGAVQPGARPGGAGSHGLVSGAAPAPGPQARAEAAVREERLAAALSRGPYRPSPPPAAADLGAPRRRDLLDAVEEHGGLSPEARAAAAEITTR